MQISSQLVPPPPLAWWKRAEIILGLLSAAAVHHGYMDVPLTRSGQRHHAETGSLVRCEHAERKHGGYAV